MGRGFFLHLSMDEKAPAMKRLITFFFVALPLLLSCDKPADKYVIQPPSKPSGEQGKTDTPSTPTDQDPDPGTTTPFQPIDAPSNSIIVGYAVYWESTMPDPALLTHINYAFAHIKDDFETLDIKNPDRLTRIAGLKKKKSSLKVLLSIGGWEAGNFSEMAADETHRKNFCKNCRDAVTKYGLDGIDIDWEYPTSSLAGISASKDDTRNFTLLMRDLRETLGRNRLLTMASASNAKYVNFTDAVQYMDFVNVMTYDMGDPPKHNAALYRSSLASESCDESVSKHVTAGVPLQKIVLGIPFYGHGDGKAFDDYVDFKDISIVGSQYTVQWDETAKVPYVMKSGKMVLTYDDEQSVGLKAEYVLQKGLCGAMYWNIEADDAQWTLSKAVAGKLIGYEDPDIPVYQVTNPYMQKYMEEVQYTDRVYTSVITNYPGGGPGEADIPPSVTLEWPAASGSQTLKLVEEGGWTRTYTVGSGVGSQELTNLVPNVIYNYTVTSSSGDVIKAGKFRTTGSIHQLFLKPKVRNARDLGGWTTTDGKTLRYRKLYRGGKVSSSNMKDEGRAEGLAQGILAELDLRELEDVPSKSYFGNDIEFLAPGFEHGYRGMLRDRAEGIKQCFEFIVNCLRKNKPVYFHCAAGRDRTGTIAMVIEGVLGVPEAQIGKDYELTYFSPADWSMQDDGLYHHMRTADGSYQPALEYMWKMSKDGTLKSGVQEYLLSIGVAQKDIDDLRTIMLK